MDYEQENKLSREDQNQLYYRRCQLCLQRCQSLHEENKNLIKSIYRLRRLLLRCRMQRSYLIEKLDQYHDNWRNVDFPLDIGIDGNGDFVDVMNLLQKPNEQHEVQEERIKVEPDKQQRTLPQQQPHNSDDTINEAAVVENVKKKMVKRKRIEKDPNAPKKPANPFFGYCKENRLLVMKEMTAFRNHDPTKQEVTKQLAQNWNTLDPIEKMVYYDTYYKSREMYRAKMECYTKKRKMQSKDTEKLP